MTDAQRLNTFVSWLRLATLAEELIVVGGVVLFLWGLTFSVIFVKIMLFLFAGALVVYVVIRVGRRRRDIYREKNRLSGASNSDDMKKLVFDDYQTPGGQYKIGFIDEKGSPQKPGLQHSAAGGAVEMLQGHTLTQEFELSEFLEYPAGGGGNEGPRAEFNSLIQRMLQVVKDMHFAHTVALFWMNREKQQLVLESYLSDSQKFMTHKRLPVASDIISRIAVNGKPQIVSNINALGQSDILPYYQSTENVKTFAGVPIFYADSREPVAVLILDCVEADAYGNETIASLVQVAMLVSILLRSYTSKYDLLLDSEVLRSINQVHEQLAIDFSAHSITRSLAEETSKLVPWDYITIILFDDSKKSWIVHYLMNRLNDSYVSLMSELDSQQSLVGGAIQSGTPRIVDDINAAGLPRFYKAERCESKGSLMIVPLNSLNRCYGTLVVESKDVKTYSEDDVKLIQQLTNTSSWALEILSLTEVMNNYVALDETTGVSTRKNFMGRLLEEVQRANDFSNDLSVVMVSVDRMDDHITRYGREAFDFILQNVGRMVKVSIRPYDVIGRFDFNCFVMLLVNTTSNEASLWAEKIRKNVASNIINIDNKSFSVTISVGVAGAGQDTSDVELLENADRVLRKAVEAGGNIVRVY